MEVLRYERKVTRTRISRINGRSAPTRVGNTKQSVDFRNWREAKGVTMRKLKGLE